MQNQAQCIKLQAQQDENEDQTPPGASQWIVNLKVPLHNSNAIAN